MDPLLIIIATIYFAMGLGGGVIIERIRWNTLIKKGIIPAPRKG